MKNDQNESPLDAYKEESGLHQSDHSAALLAEQIKLLYQQANKALLATLIISLVLVFVFYNHISKHWALGWLAAIYVLAVIRFLSFNRIFATIRLLLNQESGGVFLLQAFYYPGYFGV